jgi:hypothetical protein
MVRAAKWLLCVQLVLTVAALVVAGMALTPSTTSTSGGSVVGGAMVSMPVIACGVLLIAAAILGLVALRRPNLYLHAGIALLAPLVLAVGSSLSAWSDESDVSAEALLPSGVWQSFEETLRLLELSASLVLGAVIAAAVSGVLFLRVRRRQTL